MNHVCTGSQRLEVGTGVPGLVFLALPSFIFLSDLQMKGNGAVKNGPESFAKGFMFACVYTWYAWLFAWCQVCECLCLCTCMIFSCGEQRLIAGFLLFHLLFYTYRCTLNMNSDFADSSNLAVHFVLGIPGSSPHDRGSQ